ncbi:MAG: hypothetical protein IJX58_02465 [Clostridia bacterium]|nr:hypothetical protein [Clostridia bacterium]
MKKLSLILTLLTLICMLVLTSCEYIDRFLPSDDDKYEQVWNEWETGEYKYRSEYKTDEDGRIIFDKCYVERLDGDTFVWSAPVPEFYVYGLKALSDGVIVFGETDFDKSPREAWIAKFDDNGTLLWNNKFDNGYTNEVISKVLENSDGSYAVFSRGGYGGLALTHYSSDGEKTHFKVIEATNNGILDVTYFKGGYAIRLNDIKKNRPDNFVIIDYKGNVTNSFTYATENSYTYFTDMKELDGKLYISAYATPRLEDESDSAGGRYEVARVLNYLFDNKIVIISSEELTPMLSENYTAKLLVYNPETNSTEELQSVEGSLGGKLTYNEERNIVWDVESFVSSFYSPATSAFTIGGSCSISRYTFDKSGAMIDMKNTDETTDYRR